MPAQVWVTPFLDSLRQHGVVARACRDAYTTSTTAYALRRADADFACAWDNALEDSIDILEAEARRRALDGVEEPVVYQGQLTPVWERDAQGHIVEDEYDTGHIYPPSAAPELVGKPIMATRPRQLVVNGKPQFLTINKKSDALLQFLLKGLRKKYGTETHEVTGKDGAPLVDASTRAARVAALMELARRRAGESTTADLA